MVNKQFLEVLQSSGLATVKEVRRLSMSKDQTRITEFDLLGMDHFDEEKFARLSAKKYDLNFVDLTKAKVSPKTLSMLAKKAMKKFRVVPVQASEDKVILATFDASTASSVQELSEIFRRQVEFVLTTISAWKRLYDTAEASVDELLSSIVEINSTTESEEDIKLEDIGEDVVSFVNRILAEAYTKKVSDIHIEPYEKRFRVRFRLDGSLSEAFTPPKSMMLPIISRLKIMAQLDISEKRKPQDGRIKLQMGGNPIDYRVSTLPTLFGEKVVLRLLDQSNLQLDMTKLGFEEQQLSVFLDAIHQPYGMVLVTGPTGSGKTTTLYSALAELNREDTNISTAEDPCEFNLEGINQVNVKKEVGLTFASALKSFLRQDPDIIMVGEIRDYEVGEIAVEAALTGHMVLSTLHTNDAPAAVTRLLNMGIEGFLLVAALKAVVAQRLMRRICMHCRKIDETITPKYLTALGFAPGTAEKVKVYKGVGCENCNGTGYKGRVAIYEVLPIDAGIRDLIISQGSVDAIKRAAIKSGMKTLRMTALTKVAQGLSTVEEALGNSASDS